MRDMRARLMRIYTLVLLLLLPLLAACGGTEQPTATTGSITPTGLPGKATREAPTATATIVAVVPTPAQAPVTPREVSFTTADGIALSGTAYGQGTAAVIFSHMSDGNRGQWRDFPHMVAGRGYATLAFDSRGRGKSDGKFDPPMAGTDVQAAMAFMREQGATHIVLVGSSLGAMGSIKAATLENPAGLVFLAGSTSWGGLSISDEEMAAITGAKLFITSEGDNFVKETQHLFDVAKEPKDVHIYQGKLHGTQLFDGYKVDLEKRIIDFIEANL